MGKRGEVEKVGSPSARKTAQLMDLPTFCPHTWGVNFCAGGGIAYPAHDRREVTTNVLDSGDSIDMWHP